MSLPWDDDEIASKLEKLSSDIVAKTLATIVFKRPELLENLPQLTKTLQDTSDISDPKQQASVLDWIAGHRSSPEPLDTSVSVLVDLDAQAAEMAEDLATVGSGGAARRAREEKAAKPGAKLEKVQIEVNGAEDAIGESPDGAVPDEPSAILQFSTSVYYAKEGEDEEMSLDVMRLGNDQEEVSCRFKTADADGKAGHRYTHTEGELVFKPGEIMKQILVPIVESRAWSSSLEFKVVLSDCVGSNCTLGRYLYKCRIKVIDPDCFPTNKFENEIRLNDWLSIPMFSLLLEYFKFNFRSNPIVNRRSKHQLVTDQMSNLYFILRLYIGKIVIDKILRKWDMNTPEKGCDPGVLPFSNSGVRGYVFFNSFAPCPEDPTSSEAKYPLLIMCSIIIIIPMFFIHLLEFKEVYFKIGGTSRKTLQGNLIRKFLNYDESARAQLGASDLIMAMTRDTQSLVHDGYMQLFPLAQNMGKLAMMVVFQLCFKATYACIFSLMYPVVLITWLIARNKITTRMSQEQDVAQNELVNYVTQIMTTYRLIGDYLKRPDAVEATEARVGSFNKRMVASDAVNLNNRYCCQWLSLVCIASWFMFGGRLVMQGGELGMFVTNLQIFGDVGAAWTAIFDVMLKMQNALPYLQKIVRYMNLPIDLEKRMRVNRKRRVLGEEARKLARAEMQRQEANGVCLTGAFAADYVPIQLVNVGYSYDTPQAIHKRMLSKDKKAEADFNVEGKPKEGSLSNCTFSFAQGKLISLVGHPGDGKSTLMKILGSQMIPDTGDLLIPPHLRALHISPQPAFFNDTLMHNLMYGVGVDDKVDGSVERVTAICKMLKVSDKVLKYLDPDDTEMYGVKADWGDILSQTQRALVSLARAFIANPEILVIHKPTVVFDDSTTDNTFKCLRRFVEEKGLCMDAKGAAMRRPRTCIITTSRSKGVAAADHVFQIKPSEVIELDKNMITGDMLK